MELGRSTLCSEKTIIEHYSDSVQSYSYLLNQFFLISIWDSEFQQVWWELTLPSVKSKRGYRDKFSPYRDAIH